jgi:hypothetical protein
MTTDIVEALFAVSLYRVSHRVWYMLFKPVVDPQVKFLQKIFQCPKFNRVGTRAI